MKTREFSPMLGQTPDGTKIVCRNCIYRDKSSINVNNKVIDVGITKGTCEMFPYPDKKPSDVLFENADCPYFEQEE